MTFRRRLGVLAAVVSGLLVAGLLLSAPAFAWSADIVRLEASCPPGSTDNLVSGTVKLEPSDDSGRIEVWYRIGGTGDFTRDGTETFNPGQQLVDFHFSVPGPDEINTQIAVKTVTFFDSLPKGETPPEDLAYTNLENCNPGETTTTTEAPTTTVPPTTEAPTTTVAPPTTEAPTSTNEAPGTTAAPTTIGGALGGETTTTAGSGNLPFTGANAAPMLIAALVLVLGGGGLVLANRIRSRHAK